MTEEQKENQQCGCGADEKTILVVTHLSGIVLGFIVPLVMFFVKKDGSACFIASVKEALNFQITMFIASIVLSMFTFGLGGMAVWVANIIFCIMAAIAIRDGKDYRYPFALRLIK